MYAQSRAGNATTAFSLTELLIVTVIMAVLSAVAIPRIGSSIALRRVEAAAQHIAADLEYTRQLAVTTSDVQAVRFIAGAQPRYVMVGQTHPDHPSQAYIVYLDRDLGGTGFDSVDFGGMSEVFFDMYGRPNIGGSVVIRVGDHIRTISLDSETGQTRISD